MDSLKKALEEKYIFKKYSPSFPKLFVKEKHFLLRALKSIPRVEVFHIGSTAVRGLGGKGVLDIIIVVPKSSMKKSRSLLQRAGFIYHSTMRNKRDFFSRYYIDSSNRPRLVHMHLTFHGSGELDKALAFVEYLRANKSVRTAYSKLKKEASRLHPDDGKKYAKHKITFIRRTVKAALKWRNENHSLK